jgi:monoamine oxidase
MERGTGTTGGAQDSRFAGGSQVIAVRMAEELDGHVHMSAPVRCISQDAGGVTVVSDAGDWRAEGLSGMGLLRGGSPIREMLDNTPPDGGPGVLMGFLGGREWRKWAHRPVGERREAVLRSFAQVVGERAFDTVDYVEQDWIAEQWTQGGPTSVAAPGVLTEYGEWMAGSSVACTGRGPSSPPTGTASWPARSAPASTPPRNSCTRAERQHTRAERRRKGTTHGRLPGQ